MVAGQAGGEMKVVGRDADSADKPAFPDGLKIVGDARGPVAGIQGPKVMENVNIVRPHLAEALFNSAAEVGLPEDPVVAAGGENEFLAASTDGFAEGRGHLGVETEIEKVVDAGIDGGVKGNLAGAVSSGEAEAEHRGFEPSEWSNEVAGHRELLSNLVDGRVEQIGRSSVIGWNLL